MKLRHFSIRDLLWLCIVVALATGWGLDRFKLERARRNELAERQRAIAVARQAADAASMAAANVALQRQQFGGDAQYFPPGPERLDESPDARRTDAAKLRIWSRGAFTLEARFVRLDGDDVILRKADGAEVAVPLEELSAADQCAATMAVPAEDDVRNP